MMMFHVVSNDIFLNVGKFLVEKLKNVLKQEKRVLLFLSGGSAIQCYAPLVEFLRSVPESSFACTGPATHHPSLSDKAFAGKIFSFRKSLRKPPSSVHSSPCSSLHHANIENFTMLHAFTLKRPTLIIGQVDERFREKEVSSSKYKVVSRKKELNAETIGKTGLWDVCREKGIQMLVVSQKGTLQSSSEEYNTFVAPYFTQACYKIAVLGIGEDGHTAGLLPRYEKAWSSDSYAVGYRNNGIFPQRITLTPKAIKELDYAIVVAQGEKKRRVLDKLRKNTKQNLNDFPSGIIRQIQHVDIYTDLIF